MNNQEQNREALIEHIAEQDRIIRRRNQQIANQAQNARESQRAIEEQDARNNSLAADLAAAVVRADKAERERDEARAGARLALTRCREEQTARREVADELYRLRADEPRPVEVTDEMVERALKVNADLLPKTVAKMLTAAINPPPPRPEGAEEIEKVLRHYWNGDIDGDDLADRIAEEMNR